MTKSYLPAILFAILCFFYGCTANDTNHSITYTGRVVEVSTNTPLANMSVKVTNGTIDRASTTTTQDGIFSLTVQLQDIDNSYYLLLTDYATSITKRLALQAFGNVEYDYGDIVFLDYRNKYNLPTFEYAGFIYYLHEELGEMTWQEAITVCEALEDYEQTDWFLPSDKEIQKAYESKAFTPKNSRYWTNREYNEQSAYLIDYIKTWGDYGHIYGGIDYVMKDVEAETLPMRKEKK